MRPKAYDNSLFLLHRKWTDWAGILHLVTNLKSYASWDVILWSPFKIHAFFSWGLPPCVENTQHQKLHMNWNSFGYLLNHSGLSTVFMFPKDSQQSITLKILFLAVRRKTVKNYDIIVKKMLKKWCHDFCWKLLR